MKTYLLFISLLLCSIFSHAQVDTTYRPSYRLLDKRVPVITASSIDGKKIDSAYFANKITVIVFSSPGCAPCKYMLPKLNQWTKQFARDTFQVLFIFDANLAYTRDFRASNSKHFSKQKKKQGLDSLAFDFIAECPASEPKFFSKACMAIAKDFYVNGWPATFFVAKDGHIRNYDWAML